MTQGVRKDYGPKIAVDLDGTILSYEGWVSEETFGDPLPGAKEALQRLQDEGWFIFVHTCRLRHDKVQMHLNEHGIPFHLIFNPRIAEWSGRAKPIANVYLDDRGLTFRGDWEKALEEVLAFKTWGE